MSAGKRRHSGLRDLSTPNSAAIDPRSFLRVIEIAAKEAGAEGAGPPTLRPFAAGAARAAVNGLAGASGL